MEGTILDRIIRDSGLEILKEIRFEEKSPGRFFQAEPFVFKEEKIRMFYVVLGPGVKSPVHNHSGQGMAESHILLYGFGRFRVLDDAGNVVKRIPLQRGRFHEMFSDFENTPDHQYKAGKEGSVCLAVEFYQ